MVVALGMDRLHPGVRPGRVFAHPIGPLYGQTVQAGALACQPLFPYNTDMEGAAPKTERFEMRAPTDLLRAVDDWRRQQPDLPSRSEAIRRLIEAGLSKASTATPSGGGGPGESDKP